ncbi:MAG: aldose epimerase family protein [Oscillospiraceae bacterium]
MKITSKWFGVTRDGEAVTEYTLSSRHMSVSILDYGAVIRKILVPDRQGRMVDVVLGYDDLASYEEDSSHFGALIGRFAGRIRESRFFLDGRMVELAPNCGRHHLHGPFSHMLYRSSVSGGALRLQGFSPAGQEGYPGDLRFSVTYTLSDDGVLGMVYDAESSADTVVNLTNHSYFNLSGHGSGTILRQQLQLSASRFLENDDERCPTGELLSVAHTPFDFRRLAPIGQGFPVRGEQMEFADGYDHCFLLDEGADIAAIAHSPETGITLELVTTQPALVFYTGNFLSDHPIPGKGGCLYSAQSGFCLETQHCPDSPNLPFLPSTVLRRGEHYHEATLLKFLTLK